MVSIFLLGKGHPLIDIVLASGFFLSKYNATIDQSSFNNCKFYRQFIIGSITECQYKLMSYGIPSDQLPIKNSGIIKIQNQKKWIAFRKMKDRVIEDEGWYSVSGTFCPSTTDVIAIGGMHFYKFLGNCRYREMLEASLESYDNAASVQEKIRITNQILLNIEASGGRFLVRDKQGCWWAPANEQTARVKVSNAFRDVRKSIRARENRKRLKSDTHKFVAVGGSNCTC